MNYNDLFANVVAIQNLHAKYAVQTDDDNNNTLGQPLQQIIEIFNEEENDNDI